MPQQSHGRHQAPLRIEDRRSQGRYTRNIGSYVSVQPALANAGQNMVKFSGIMAAAIVFLLQLNLRIY